MAKEVKMNVELVAYTQGCWDISKSGDNKAIFNIMRPVEVCGRAGGMCYDKEEKEDYGRFIRGIIKSGHESVIEHVSFTFKVTGVSRALTHQLVRHRLASYSQRSQRYCKEDEFGYIMPPGLTTRKDDEETFAQSKFKEFMEKAQEMYDFLLDAKVKPQDARFVLPNACETRIFITMNARELRHFFKERLNFRAQWEIRRMACKMFDLVYVLAPDFFADLVDDLRNEDGNEPFLEVKEDDR